MNCVGSTRSQYHPGMVKFQTGSLLKVNIFGAGQENRSRVDLPGSI